VNADVARSPRPASWPSETARIGIRRWLGGRTGLLAIVIVAGSVVLGLLATAVSAPVLSYEALLPKVVSSSPDAPADVQTTLYAATQGLALSAAAAVGDEEQVVESRDWLLGDMRPAGWGAAWELDAFFDGTITPANTPYAAATAVAIDGLLDAGADAATVDAISRIVVHWATDGWEETEDGGYFWFSLAEHDAIYAPSSSAMLMGAVARTLGAHPDAFDAAERQMLHDTVESALAQLDATRNGMEWEYAAVQPLTQDLRQHVSVLVGGERARDAGFEVPWTRGEAIASLELFRSRNQLGVWPTDEVMTPDMQRRRISPFLIAGVGAAEAFTNVWGGPDYANDLRLSLASSPSTPQYTAYALLAVATQPPPDR
jgi:hypothetical protein